MLLSCNYKFNSHSEKHFCSKTEPKGGQIPPLPASSPRREAISPPMKPASSFLVSKWSLNTGLRRPRSYYCCVPKQHSCDSAHSKLPGLQACVIVCYWIPLVIPVLIMFSTRCCFGACSRPQLYKDVGINAITCPVICPLGLRWVPIALGVVRALLLAKDTVDVAVPSGNVECLLPILYLLWYTPHTCFLRFLVCVQWRQGSRVMSTMHQKLGSTGGFNRTPCKSKFCDYILVVSG